MNKILLVLIIGICTNSAFTQNLGLQSAAYHTIGLHADGKVYTWGRNYYGQLGDGTATTSSPYGKLTPVGVLAGAYSGTTYLGDDSGNKITAVALGGDHTISLAADGTVYSWGSNGYGRLGDGTTSQRNTPIKVLKGAYSGTTYLGDNSGNKITMVALGYEHSVALAADGTVYSWGYNNSGRLGDGTTTNRSTPVKVLKGAYSGTTYLGDDPGNKIISVALGFYHSIALAADGTVYTWGDNAHGKLGNNNGTTDSYIPVKVLMGEYSGTTYLGDDANNKITTVALGDYHSMALAADGTVYTWGGSSHGQLGYNSTTASSTPVKVWQGEYSGTTYLGDDSGNKITSVALGGYHSIAVAADGTVYTWGNNVNGRLGNNSTTNSSTPVKVLEGEYSGTTYLGDDSGNKITSVAAGTEHSIALATDGSVYTWGSNQFGKLGDNTVTQRLTPIKVHGLDNVGDLSLPVVLSSFSVSTKSADAITLIWITESEAENLGFILERRSATTGWQEIASYLTHEGLQGQGSVSRQTSYTYTDNKVEAGEIYDYRLADISYQGEKEYYTQMVVGIQTPENLPSAFALHQNYPNPFNPTTSIQYSLPEEGSGQLLIFDILGQEVISFQDANKYPGKHEVHWNGMDQSGNQVNTGVYFCRLQEGDNSTGGAGSFTQTIKMVYLK